MAKKKRKKNMTRFYISVIILLALVIAALFGVVSCVNSCVAPKSSEDEGTPSSTPQDNIDDGQGSDTSESEQEVNIPINHEDDWALYVIGNDDPLPEDFTVVTETVVTYVTEIGVEERKLDERCADYAVDMLKAAELDGIDLYVTSAYRSVQKQAENLESYINSLKAQGWSAAEAEAQAKKEIAMPGRSEHNAGLAMDVVSSDYWSTHDDLDESFEELPHFDWLIDNSWKYGFVLSYPEGKEDITGFIYEPWHYRFVGLSHAERIHKVYEDTGEFLTVNEYIERYIN